jgi:uncharacterized protein YndB with AHSA1/START domain
MEFFLGGMDMANVSLKFQRKVAAPVEEVYRAFTNSMVLREWLCNTATVDPHVGGHIYLAWNSGFYCAGEFTSMKQNEEIRFTSLGKCEPNATEIKITLAPTTKGSSFTVEHSGFKPGWKWRKFLSRITVQWTDALENLIHVLERGPDLRIINRPMLGIFFGDFNEGIAKNLGVPVNYGVRLVGVVPGMGAAACGLQKDDVITELDSKEVKSVNSLPTALVDRKANDKVQVVFYRGSKRMTAIMTLSARPLPKIPTSSAAFATSYQKNAEKDYKELATVLKGVPNTLAAKKPAKNEWSANENLAHLIEGERGWHVYIHQLLFSAEQVSDGFGDNSNERIQAEVAAYTTTKDLLFEFKRSQQVTVGFLKNLPKSFQVHKGTWWHLAMAMLAGPNTHAHEHAEQVKKAFELAKKMK